MNLNTIKYYEIQELISNKYHKSDLLIVTKNRSVQQIIEYIKIGHLYFGENKVQEAKNKFNDQLLNKFKNIHLSLIGPLQTNKVNLALQLFDDIQSIDRIKLIDEIEKQLKKIIKPKTRNFFVQVNIGRETQKSGVHPEETKEIIEYSKKKNLNIVGLMCIPPNAKDPSLYFEEMRLIRDSINKNLLLSMGMSNDYDLALKHGSNLIRIGSLLFND